MGFSRGFFCCCCCYYQNYLCFYFFVLASYFYCVQHVLNLIIVSLCQFLHKFMTPCPLMPGGKSRPTVHVMVSSLLFPPPPPTFEGATAGATMRQQQQNSAHMLRIHTNNANPHRLCNPNLAAAPKILPLQIQYQCHLLCQMQHLKVSVGTLPLKEIVWLKFSCFARVEQLTHSHDDCFCKRGYCRPVIPIL